MIPGASTGKRVTRLVLVKPGVSPSLQVVHEPLSMGPNDVRVAVIQSPVLPSDRNILTGTYAHAPTLPSSLGRDGVGRVIAIGAAVKSVSVGDRVIGLDPYPSYGFWATETVIPESLVWKVPGWIPDPVAATMAVNGLTAWLLLTRFDATQGVIQNAANSSVGAWVNYWAAALGIWVINVVRRTEALDGVLQPAGPVYVVGDSGGIGQSVGLALNAVGGDSAGYILKALGKRGTMVTYGAMGQAPIPLSNAALIYRQLIVVGFLRSAWAMEMGPAGVRVELAAMAECLARQSIDLPTAYPMLYPQTDFTDLTEKTANRLLGF